MYEEALREILMRELTPRQRQVVTLLMENGSISKTAQTLGVYPSTVTRTRNRAYIRIARCLRYGITGGADTRSLFSRGRR